MSSYATTHARTHRDAPDAHFCAGKPASRPYILVPRALLRICGANALAVGLFLLIARLYFIYRAPVPLSADDIRAYDPSLTRGSIVRALQRLEAAGFLVITGTRPKACYLPAWGRVNQACVPYDAHVPSLGKPAHLTTERIDRAIIDVGLGRLVPYERGSADISRYTATPLLTLRDAGAYALGVRTPTLHTCGLIDANDQPQPVDSARLLAAQPPAADTGIDSPHHAPDTAGSAGDAAPESHPPEPATVPESHPPEPATVPESHPPALAPVSEPERADSPAPAPESGSMPTERMIGLLIGLLIGSTRTWQDADSASCCPNHASDQCEVTMTGNQKGIREEGNPPPTPPQTLQEEEGVARQDLLPCSEPDDQKPDGQTVSRATAPAVPAAPAGDPRSRQLLQAHRVYPNLRLHFAAINPATLAASLYDLDATGSGIGAIISRWKVEPPQPDAADDQALAVAPADWSAERLATLASFLRDGLPADDALDATRDWTRPGARARQETAATDRDHARRRRGPPPVWHDHAPRRSMRAQPDTAGQNEAARWVETHAPADFDAAMRETMQTMYQQGLRDANDVIISTRMFHERLARQGRTTGVYA